MDWKQIGEQLAQVGLPLLGTALGGPGGGLIGKALAGFIGSDADPKKVLESLHTDPETLVKMREFEAREKEALLAHNAAIHKSETERLAAVNATMQAESKSEHWAQWAWRPAFGFVTAFAFLEVVTAVTFMFYRAIIEKQADALAHLPNLVNSFVLLFGIPGAILGVASWHRGRDKLAKTLGGKWGAK